MATRGNIAIYNSETLEAKVIYTHFDSYYEHMGVILTEHYNTTEKVEELISYGDLSSLETTIAETKFYGRDYNESNTKAKTKGVRYESLKRLKDNEHLYVWIIQENKWFVY